MNYFIYIITNVSKTVLYTGITNDLNQRLIEHFLSAGDAKSFTGKYNVHFLLYYERYADVRDAIEREKEIKGWSRDKKIKLIKEMNPDFKFLNDEIFDVWPPKDMLHRKKL